MQPAGLAEVEQAKADGRWAAAYEPQSAITVPDDLAAELARNDSARAFFETLNSVNRYAILYRITSAQRPETRARRIAKFVAMLAEHRKICLLYTSPGPVEPGLTRPGWSAAR